MRVGVNWSVDQLGEQSVSWPVVPQRFAQSVVRHSYCSRSVVQTVVSQLVSGYGVCAGQEACG